jgi:hypothetical protein
MNLNLNSFSIKMARKFRIRTFNKEKNKIIY